jgi:predicted ATPase
MIKDIHLQNFKAFQSQDFSLERLTLLSGLNGSGKSTLLQSLAVVRQSWEAGTLGEGGLLLNGDLVALGTGKDVLHEDYIQELSGPPLVTIGLETTHGTFEWRMLYVPDADLLHIVGDLPSDVEELALLNVGFQYIRADRISPAVNYPRSYDRTVRKHSLGARGEHTINYLREFSENVVDATRRHSEATSTRLLDQTTAWLQEFCPGVNIQPHDIEGTDFVRLDYGFFGTAGIDSSNRYRPTNVGFGLTYVLPLVVACLTAPAGALLLFENPEAHLHPRGQSIMATLCARAAASGVQVLVESHSDHFLNGMRLAVKSGIIPPEDTSLIFFDRANVQSSNVSQPRIAADGMLSDWPIGFFDEWDNALNKLLN